MRQLLFLLIVSRIHIFGVIKKRKENINNGKTEITKMRSRKILQENHTSKENRLAFANGVIYALANVTTGLKGKERFLRDYTEGILHAAYVLYEKKMSLEK